MNFLIGGKLINGLNNLKKNNYEKKNNYNTRNRF